MPERIFRIGFFTKIIFMAFAMILFFGPDSFGREGVKLYSIGNNSAWNSSSSWSLSVNGPASDFIPQSNDTIIIDCPIVQNINFSFSDNGFLEVLNTGLLRGDNLDLTFWGNAVLKCNGEIKTNNLTFNENSAFFIENYGKVTVKNSLVNNSLFKHNISGKLSVTGSLLIGPSVTISGNGVVQSAQYSGSGTVFGISPASLVPDGSLITESNWMGSVNNEWNEPQNWSGALLPGENSNISVLSSSHNPLISTDVFCNNLFINSLSKVTVNPAALISVSGNLTVLGMGKFLLKNTLTEKSALILKGEAAGKIQVEYPVEADERNLVSSPVDMALSGTFLNMYLRTYNESLSQWGDYIVPTNDPLQMMQGYEIYSLFSETRIFEGTPNNNPKTFAISNSGNGLNLTGNPFPCFIDWENSDEDASQRNSIAAAIYYPDPAGSGNFSVYLPGGSDAVSLNNGSRYIAPMQGFFVKAGKQGLLTLTEKSRVLNLNDSRVAEKNNFIKFKLADSDGLTDEVLFRVIANSTFGFDDQMDAVKLKGNADSPSLSLKSDDDTQYAINTVPTINSSLEIPLNIECTKSGVFSVSTLGSFNFEYRYPVILEDKELNTFIDLRADSAYFFSHSPEMNSDRFVIHFNSTEGIGEQGNVLTTVNITPGEVRVYGVENDVYTANLYTTDGKLISSSKGVLSEGINLTSGNQPNCICILQLLNGKQTITKKILTK
jgi:trimeric autotransporter adhesin